MKHISLLAAAIVPVMLMTACGKEQPKSEEPVADKTVKQVKAVKDGIAGDVNKQRAKKEDVQRGEPVGLLQIPNPIRGTSMEDIRQKMGLDFGLPDGAEDIRYSTILDKTAQVDFNWSDAECTGRVQHSGETQLQDISGYYYQWDNAETVNVGYNKAQVKWTHTEDGRDIGICIWWDAVPGLMYSVSMDNAATKEALSELANAFYIQMQGETE